MGISESVFLVRSLPFHLMVLHGRHGNVTGLYLLWSPAFPGFYIVISPVVCPGSIKYFADFNAILRRRLLVSL